MYICLECSELRKTHLSCGVLTSGCALAFPVHHDPFPLGGISYGALHSVCRFLLKVHKLKKLVKCSTLQFMSMSDMFPVIV